MNLIREIWQSIVRRDPLSTDKGKSELVFFNVWLHVHPAKVKKENLRFKHTFYLGFITSFSRDLADHRHCSHVLLQAVSSAGLPGHEGPPVRRIHGPVPACHAPLAAHGMVICVFLHMCRVFYTGSYKKPRQFNWVIGVFLLLLTLSLSFTGYLLPWISWRTGQLRLERISAAMRRSSAASFASYCLAVTALERLRCCASMCSTLQSCQPSSSY